MEQPTGISYLPGLKVLVVDDREDNLVSIETILEKDRFTVTKANSGRAALRILLHEHDFTIILMDVQMPDMNGYETANLIYQREKLRSIPIIFITAHSQDENFIFKGYRMGAVDYIYKPVSPELLRAKVNVFAELYHKNHQLILQEKKLLVTNKSLQKEIEDRKISEEKIGLLNDQLVDHINHLKTVNEELDRFAYVASHDLQEPLRKIMLFADKIMGNGQIDEETEKNLKKITSSSSKMQHLINDLLRFSRHEIHPSDFIRSDLNVLVKEVVSDLEIDIEKCHAKVSVGRLPVIWAVPGLMRQLFFNLINNAIKFRSDSCDPVISVFADKTVQPPLKGLKNGSSKTPYDIIYVTDNGIGFDAKYTEDIFVLFKRLHSYNEFEGSGVGLSICKRIIEKHNGFITAKSKDGEGSTFIIGIPESQLSVAEL